MGWGSPGRIGRTFFDWGWGSGWGSPGRIAPNHFGDSAILPSWLIAQNPRSLESDILRLTVGRRPENRSPAVVRILPAQRAPNRQRAPNGVGLANCPSRRAVALTIRAPIGYGLTQPYKMPNDKGNGRPRKNHKIALKSTLVTILDNRPIQHHRHMGNNATGIWAITPSLYGQ